MANRFACGCDACRVRAVRGPVLLTAVGLLFSLDLVWHVVAIDRTWPILLIVAGLSGVAARIASQAGHGLPPGQRSIGSDASVFPPVPPPPPPPEGIQDAP